MAKVESWNKKLKIIIEYFETEKNKRCVVHFMHYSMTSIVLKIIAIICLESCELCKRKIIKNNNNNDIWYSIGTILLF